MATCWYCESFVDEDGAICRFCGTAKPGSKPKWVEVLDALPEPQDQRPSFSRWFVAWELVLILLGLWYWPWWAAPGAVVISLLAAVPAAMVTTVLIQQLSRLWLAMRSRLLRPPGKGLLALEAQTSVRLREDQEAFDTLVGIINRERRHRDLIPDAVIVEYRKYKVLPVFGQMVRLSTSALLEMEVCRLINQGEQICDGAEACDHQELNRRYERLEDVQRELGTIKKRWSDYLCERVAVLEHAATSGPSTDQFAPRLPQDATLLSVEDLDRLSGARDTLRQLRHALHQTQELRLLRSAKPLASHEESTRVQGMTMSGVSASLREIQISDRLDALERVYQRVVAEQRTVRDTSTFPDVSVAFPPANVPPESEGRQKRIDAPVILSNSLPRH